ncbi:hypothetical protein EX30DRAFT_375782 [Ascodesmis nigricans]|uniref:CCHC-type domain-containing protein n=1 Tax=Ascodesmis nigricans TaxID=341454 RepID=A0A4S2MHC4_9PEZI|nr:hypothetical protein EX30DRAFT_375782 [Ascodesmis nigricans]
MPQPLTAGAPSFNGRNVTKFLQNFKRMVKTYGSKQPLDSFIEELPDYCTDDIAEEVRLLKGYSEGNWKVFRQSMETRYALRDSEQAKYSITYLRTAADEYKQGILTMRDYYTRYSIAVGKMKRKGLITDRELVTLFISGLSKEQQIEAVKKTQLDMNDPLSLNWDSMVDVVAKWVSYEDALAAMLGSAEAAESQSTAAAPKQVSWNPQPRRALAPSGGHGPVPNPASAAPRRDYEAMVDDVIEKFGNLSLANKRAVKSRVMEITQGEGDRTTVVNVINTVLPEFKTTAPEIPSSPYRRREMRPDRPLVCYYCSMEGHTVQFCGDLVIDRSQGLVHKGEDGMRRTGTVTNPGRTIPPYGQRGGATEKDWVRANQPSIHGTSSANVYASYRRRYGEVAKELEEAEVIKGHDGVIPTYGKGSRITKIESASDADDSDIEDSARVDPKRVRPATDSDSTGCPKGLLKRPRQGEPVVMNDPISMDVLEEKKGAQRKTPRKKAGPPCTSVKSKQLGLDIHVSREQVGNYTIRVEDDGSSVFAIDYEWPSKSAPLRVKNPGVTRRMREGREA